jgi:Fe-Mn family superoxide dismutase
MIVLPKLPYAYDALEPVISETTMRTHHDKHHARYVDVANALLADTTSEKAPLEHVVTKAWLRSDQKLFNNAAQAFNHGLFWACMSPRPLGAVRPLRARPGSGFRRRCAGQVHRRRPGPLRLGLGLADLEPRSPVPARHS